MLRRLTARQRWDTAEEGTGVWNELDRLLYRNQVEMRVRKRRLLDMLRSYRAAAAALPDAVVVLDRNSQRVQWFNEAATALLGLHHPGDLGEALVERLQPMPQIAGLLLVDPAFGQVNRDLRFQKRDDDPSVQTGRNRFEKLDLPVLNSCFK